MLYFENDYSEGAHPKILQRLMDTNMEHLSGYGSDRYTDLAKNKIRDLCKCPEAEVYFLVGGTQTNQTVIDSVLKSYEGVIAAETGPVSVHEAGAIEFHGHKVLTLPQHDGKLCARELKDYMETFLGDDSHEHMVFPGMVYISHPTEYGTLYTKDELKELSQVCRRFKLPLYMDGARLITGLACPQNELSLPDIADLCDVFYIGGTKAGALCGEAVVFTKNNTPAHFLTQIKQHGALLAKGRLCGVQFDALFSDDLYKETGRNAIETAALLREGLRQKGYTFYNSSPTNQLFLVMENSRLEELKNDTRTVICYEAPHRLVKTLKELLEALGNRRITICRELTKKHETAWQTHIAEACEYYQENAPKGGRVLVIEGRRREELKAEEQEQREQMP